MLARMSAVVFTIRILEIFFFLSVAMSVTCFWPRRRRLHLKSSRQNAPQSKALSVRLAGGEDFATLAAQNSEDEATKLRGGDLGYFSADRMPPDFVEAAAKLRPRRY